MQISFFSISLRFNLGWEWLGLKTLFTCELWCSFSDLQKPATRRAWWKSMRGYWTYRIFEYAQATRSLKVFWYMYLFFTSYILILFIFTIYGILIYFMHEYILKIFILCIYIWNQMYNIMFQFCNYIREFYSSLYYILIFKYTIWFSLIWLCFMSKWSL